MDGRRVMAIIRHELRLIGRDPFPVAVLVLFPILAMVFLKPAFKFALVADGYQGANGSEQVVPGPALRARARSSSARPSRVSRYHSPDSSSSSRSAFLCWTSTVVARSPPRS